MFTKDELLDFLRNLRSPVRCAVPPARKGHVLVRCGSCSVLVPINDPLTATTLNQIERRLEPCLGPNWIP